MKNLFKSIFISAFNLLAISIVASHLFFIYKSGFSFAYLGAIISALTVVVYFAGLYLLPRARTSLHLKTHTIIIILGLLISLIPYYNATHNYILKALPSALLLIAWLAYVQWYSHLGRIFSEKLKIGNQLPSFELEDSNKNMISSSFFKGSPTIFMFYRGNWCPLCMAQIKELAASYKVLEEKGVLTALISPQSQTHTKALAKKYAINFYFLTDVGNKLAKQLGIVHKNGLPTGLQLLGYASDTVYPTVIITDKNAKIIYLDQTANYRIRPEPEEFLKVIHLNTA